MAAKGSSLPIIIVTGSGDADPRVLSNQVFGFIDKPSNPEKLLGLVHRALKNREDDMQHPPTRNG